MAQPIDPRGHACNSAIKSAANKYDGNGRVVQGVANIFVGKVEMSRDSQSAVGQMPYKFNPSFLTDEGVIQSFVVRRAELAEVLAILQANRSVGRNQQILVSAPRGAGKTTLVRRVLAEVRTSSDLSKSWFPLIFGEESYSITTPGEFFLECLFHLQDQVQDKEVHSAFLKAQDQTSEDSLLKVSLEAIRNFSEKTDRKILLIVENIHMIFGEQIGKDAAVLKELLENEKCLMLLATSVKDGTNGLEEPDSRLFEGFTAIVLQPLDLEESQQLWKSLTGQTVRAERIRPIQILTGGSPRLMRIMAEFTVSPSLQNLMENLNQLIDQNTEYFKSQLDNLPPTERKVFAALLDIWDPSTAKQVADSARVNVNIASAMLGRLADRGAVVKLPGKGRAAAYHAAERLFNIYYLMRRRNHPSNRVRALVTFMTQYYRGDELIDTTAKLVAEACLLDPVRRQEYHSAFSAIIAQSSGEIRQKILSQTPEDFLSPIANSEEFRQAVALSRHKRDDEQRTRVGSRVSGGRKRAALLKRVKAAADDHPEIAENLLREAIAQDENSSQLWLELAFLLGREEGRLVDALAAARKSIELEPASSLAHALLGSLIYEGDTGLEDAEKHFQLALELDADNIIALSSLGDLRHREGKIEEAYDLYKRAWEIAPDLESALIDLVSIVGPHLERNDEAEALLREGLGDHPEWTRARRMLSQCLLVMDRAKEAQEVLQEGIERDAESSIAWADLALFLHRRLDKPAEAISAYKRAIELDGNQGFLWQAYAEALYADRSDLSAAREAAEKAIELEPDSHSTLVTLAEIYVAFEEFSKAEDAYRTAVELPEAGFYPWYEYGLFLQRISGRLDDSEIALRNAVAEMDDPICVAPKELAALLVHRGRDDEAAPLLEQAVEINSDCYCSLTLHGGVATRKGDIDKAKSLLTRAHEVNPQGVTAMTSLAQIAVEFENNLALAEEWVTKAVAANPKDARVFLARGLVRRAQGLVDECIADLEQSIEILPRFVEAKLLLVKVTAEHRDPPTALKLLAEVLAVLDRRRELLSGVVDATVALARRGLTKEIQRVFEDANVQEILEPLVVALELSQGNTPVKAKEVLEVARDIADRIAVG